MLWPVSSSIAIAAAFQVMYRTMLAASLCIQTDIERSDLNTMHVLASRRDERRSFSSPRFRYAACCQPSVFLDTYVLNCSYKLSVSEDETSIDVRLRCGIPKRTLNSNVTVIFLSFEGELENNLENVLTLLYSLAQPWKWSSDTVYWSPSIAS